MQQAETAFLSSMACTQMTPSGAVKTTDIDAWPQPIDGDDIVQACVLSAYMFSHACEDMLAYATQSGSKLIQGIVLLHQADCLLISMGLCKEVICAPPDLAAG